MSEEIEVTEKSKTNGIYILIILALLILAGVLGWQLSNKNKDINALSFQKEELTTEMNVLNEMMYDQGVEAGEDLKMNLQNMLDDYETMEALNTDLNDSILEQKQNIIDILEELKKEKKNKKYYASKVYKLEKETETLRSIMKDYVNTIDSLNTENLNLKTNLSNTRKDLSTVIRDRDNLQDVADDLSEQVNAGSKLSATSIVSEGIRERSSGSFKVTDRAGRATHVRACFTLAANKISSAGNKPIYLRVISDDGTVLYSSNSNTFKTEDGKNLVFSDKKTINYQRKAVDVCIFYKLVNELAKGNYVTEIWSEGVKIGKNSFVLK